MNLPPPSKHEVETAPDIILWGQPRKSSKEFMLEALAEPVPEGQPAHTRQSLAKILGKAPNNCVAPLRELVDDGMVIEGQIPGDKRIFYRIKDDG